MTVTGVRYLGSAAGWGYSVASSGRYVIMCATVAPTFWLWRRDDAGVLQLLLQDYAYTPPIHNISRCACWYNESEARLEIVVGMPGDSNPTRKSGSLLFMDWPDDGTQASDMVELGKISAHPDDQYDPQSIGNAVAICNGRCIAMGSAGLHNVLFLSRTGDTWSRDKLDTTTYDDYWNFDAPPVGLVEHPTIEGKVVGVIPCAYYGTYGAHFVVTSTGPGDTWSDVARLDGNVGGGGWWTARGGNIGPGANGNLTIAADWGQNPEGFAIWDRDPTDDTDATWIYRGRVKCANRERPIAIAVGYNFIAGGDNYIYLGSTRVGPINATVFDGPAPGAWNVDQYAEFYFAGPDYHALEDGMLHPNGMALGYQEGGIVRLVTGCYAYKPGPPPGSGSATGGFIEHSGDDDWPSPPDPQPVDTDLTVNQIVVVAKDIIGVRFTEPVTVTSSLLDPTSYTISGGVSVAEIFPFDASRTTLIVYLRLTPKATYQNSYVLTIPSIGEITEYEVGFEFPAGTIYTPYGVPIATITVPWLHHRTKTDAVLASLPGMYNKGIDGNIRSILQAITMSDEEIGGDF